MEFAIPPGGGQTPRQFTACRSSGRYSATCVASDILVSTMELHPDARKRFDEVALSFVDRIVEVSEQQPVRSTPGFYSQGTISEENMLGPVKVWLKDGLGETVGFVFVFQNTRLGIVGEPYKDLAEFCIRVQNTKPLKDKVSVDFILGVLRDWLESRYANAEESTFTSTLLKAAEAAVEPCEIWIPVPFTAIEEEFQLGMVSFKTITYERIQSWMKTERNDPKSRSALLKRIQEQFQGHAAAQVSVTAEPVRAAEIAYEQASNAFSVLRLFTASNFRCLTTSAIYEYGHGMMESKHHFTVADGNFSYTQEQLSRGKHEILPRIVSETLAKESMEGFHSLLKNPNQNEFTSKLFEAIKTYSKHTLRYELHDKFLYILPALESLLLRNENEPLMQNLGERLAFAIAESLDTRKEVVRTVKEIYAVRSQYFHHGVKSPRRTDLVDRFLNHGWQFLNFCVQTTSRFQTHIEMLDYLDDRKLS